MGDWPKEEISEGVFVDVDPESVIRSQAAEIARLREEVGRLGRDNNALKYGPEHFGGRMHQQVIDDLRADLGDARTALADAQARSYTLAVAIMGGEDAPGLADATDAESLADQLGKERAARMENE